MGKKKAHDFGILKGNPLEITYKQHFLPNGLMRRFSINGKKIYRIVKSDAHAQLINYDRNDDYAISLRAWNTKTENFFTAIENEFYAVCKRVDSGVDNLSKGECVAVSNFLASWKVRPKYLRGSGKFRTIKGISEPKIPSEIISELCEKSGLEETDIIQYIRESLEKGGGGLSGPTREKHEFNSIDVIRDYVYVSLKLKNINWVVHRLSDLEIALPDVPMLHCVSINPKTVLLPDDSLFDTTSVDGISRLNYTIIAESRSAYWCHDINRLIKLP